MNSKSSLFSLSVGFLYALQDQVQRTVGTPDPANATVTSTTYYSNDSDYNFIDINGGLSDIIAEYSFEVIVTGLGFGEGPKWIQDCSYYNNGYMLIADQYSDCIWRYYTDDGTNYMVECIRVMDGDSPNAVGWNFNFPTEIYVALQGGNAVARLNLTDDGLTELNRWNVSNDGTPLWNVNDVILDSQGNAYFTNYPFDYDDPDIVSGTWMIPRATMEVELIEQLNYGTNGIAMTLDEELLVVANSMDFPVGTFDGGDTSQANYSNVFWRGYANSGSMSTKNNFTADDAFYYLEAINALDYFEPTANGDGSAFDFDGNYWQAEIRGDTAEGFILITNAIEYGNNESAIIGMINFTNTGYGPTNIAKGMDGYMYVTLTQWSGDCSAGEPGWGCGGVLGRIPLVNYYTSDGANDYVLDCDDSTADMTTTDSPDGMTNTTDSADGVTNTTDSADVITNSTDSTVTTDATDDGGQDSAPYRGDVWMLSVVMSVAWCLF